MCLWQSPKVSIFGHLLLFAPAFKQPLNPTYTLIDKNNITGCCYNNLYREKAIPGSFHPIVPPSPAICLKIPFLAIHPHLRLLMGNPLTPPPLLLTKMLLFEAIAIIYTDKKLFLVVSTPLFRHLLPFAWKFHFWPFYLICRLDALKGLDIFEGWHLNHVTFVTYQKDFWAQRIVFRHMEVVFSA